MNEGKTNQAHDVRTERLELRLPMAEKHAITAHCLAHGLVPSAWIRGTLKAAILKALAYPPPTPVTIDPRDAAEIEKTKGKK